MTTAPRSIFVLTPRPEPGVDGIRALRAALKSRHRLRCITAREKVRPMKRRRRITEEHGPLVGLVVRLPDVCRCGHDVARIGAPVGPHLAGLTCARCARHRGWLPRIAHQFLLETVTQFGRPDTPICIRRGGGQCAPPTPPAQCASDLAASPDPETEETLNGRET
jgi:hypothetical protein